MDTVQNDRFNQGEFCGSACCVAGHTILEFGTAQEQDQFNAAVADCLDEPDFDDGVDVSTKAAELLGLSHEEEDYLFCIDWPVDFQTPHGVTPAMAAKRLRHFAKTGSLFVGRRNTSLDMV